MSVIFKTYLCISSKCSLKCLAVKTEAKTCGNAFHPSVGIFPGPLNLWWAALAVEVLLTLTEAALAVEGATHLHDTFVLSATMVHCC